MEHLAQMVPMLVIAGLSTGWVAEAVSRAGGYGLIPDMIIGLAGGGALAVIVWFLVSTPIGMVGTLLIGCIGATAAVVAQRRLWRSLGLRA